MNKSLKIMGKLVCILILLSSSTFNQPDAKSYYESGLASLNKKEYIQAIGEFTNAISLNPNYADAYYYRGYAKDLLGKSMGYFSSELCSVVKEIQLNNMGKLFGIIRKVR